MNLVELDNGDMIYLKSFPSVKIGEFLTFAKEHRLIDKNLESIHATGGGAYKYNDLFEQEVGSLGVKINKHDEMESMVNGMSFILNHGKESSFTFKQGEGKRILEKDQAFPKLLVSVGSGVSIIKVNDFSSY